MPKAKREFKPTHYRDIDSVVTLRIEIVKSNGECFVYGAYYNRLTQCLDKVTVSTVRTNSYGNLYFVKNNQRYYLADFFRETPF